MINANAFSEITVSAQTLMYHITRFQDRGGVLPDRSVFDAWNVDLTELEDSDERFPIKLVAIALEYAQQQLQDPVLGLNHVDPDNEWFPDFLTLLASNSTKVESFIQLYSRYFCLHSEIGTLAVVHHHPYSEIRFVPKARQVLSYHQIDGALLILKVVIERLFGLLPESAFVDHLCPAACESIYQDKFSSEVSFEQLHNALVYKTEDLLKPLQIKATATPQEYLLPVHLEHRRDRLYGKDQLEKTQFLIRQLLMKGEPSRDQVAKELAMSLRSFQRFLSQHDTTYKSLLENIRKELAMDLLRNSNFSVQHIALLTGYTETSQFYKAFKRWFEHSPKYYRSLGSHQSHQQPIACDTT